MRNIAKRQKFIITELEKSGFVQVLELSNLLGVSEVTIRKDLKVLESRNLLYRSHGGASLHSLLIGDRHIDEKEKIQTEEKYRIAEYAVQLLEKDDIVIIASGTTVLALARKMNDLIPLTVITPSVKVTSTLSYISNIEIIQLGGNIRKSSASSIGVYAEELLKEVMCNKLFMGVDGIDVQHGLTTSNLNEAHLNQCMMKSAQKVIIMTDSTKFERRGFGKICEINQVDMIITDKNAPSSTVQIMRDKGIEVVLV